MINYRNIENFEAWLKSVLNERCLALLDIDHYLEELDERYCTTGCAVYEIAGRYTKSGNPECYSFEVEDEYDDNDEWIGRTYVL